MIYIYKTLRLSRKLRRTIFPGKQKDHLIVACGPDLIIINQKKRELAESWTLLSHLTTE